MSKIKNSGLDQYGAEPFEQQQFGTAGVEGLKVMNGWAPRLLLTVSNKPINPSVVSVQSIT